MMEIKQGEIYTVKGHVVACGDSLDQDFAEKVIGGRKIRAIVSDPPFGVEYVESKRIFNNLGVKNAKNIIGDQLQSDEEYQEFTRKWLEAAKPHLEPYNACYIFNSDLMYPALRKGMEEAGLHYSQMIVWVKNHSIVGRKDYLPMFELIAYGWQGKHTPIITKELFDAVQEKIQVEKKKTHGREFAFTRMLACAHCGSGITAEEKLKELKDGGFNAHIYYRCTKVKNRDCPNPPVKEQVLIEEMLAIIDRINLDKTELREKLEREVDRYALFQTGVLKQALPSSQKQKEISIKTFAKYILEKGTLLEQREILSAIKSKILLKDKKLFME